MIVLLNALIGLGCRYLFRLVLAVFAGLLVGCGVGCTQGPREWPSDPSALVAPYEVAGGGEVVWAVAPLRNESGVSVVDELRLSDRLVEEIRQANGVTALPLNRTLEAMRAAGVASVETAAEARSLARRMGVDGIVVGTVTSWSPYEPPEIGMTVALYAAAEGSMESGATPGLIDPFDLTRAATGPVTSREGASRTGGPSGPLSEVSAHLSGANGAVRTRVEAYATGRADPNSATGWRGYLTTMRRFERFAAFEMLGRLLAEERARLGGGGGAVGPVSGVRGITRAGRG